MNIIFCFYVITVPAPDVVVTATYTTPLYAGSSLTLTCNVTLDPNVDNNETVRLTTSWNGPNHISGKRYLVTNASNSDRTYVSSLTINPIVQQDNGTYIICIYWNCQRRK